MATRAADAHTHADRKRSQQYLHSKTLPARFLGDLTGTKFAQQPPLNSTSETKFALLPENGPFLGILALQGEFCLADTEKMTSRANLVSPRGQALDCWANFRTQQRWTNDHPRTGCRSSWHTAAPGKLARNSLTRTFNKR